MGLISASNGGIFGTTTQTPTPTQNEYYLPLIGIIETQEIRGIVRK
jgi:hypothetical protein